MQWIRREKLSSLWHGWCSHLKGLVQIAAAAGKKTPEDGLKLHVVENRVAHDCAKDAWGPWVQAAGSRGHRMAVDVDEVVPKDSQYHEPMKNGALVHV
jgi:hypothetical protein